MLAETPLDAQIRGLGLPTNPDSLGPMQQPSAHSNVTPAPLDADAAAPAALRDIDVDAKGRALARGRRKASSARVWLSHGVGDVIVNKMPLGVYFNTVAQRAAVVAPLTAMGRPGQWNIQATVESGGELRLLYF
jgi:Ribosomal protein S9/S16